MSLMSLILQSLLGFSTWLLLYDKSEAELAPSIRFHKLWGQSRLLFSPLPLIFYFSNHSAAFGFQSSTPPGNITLNPSNMKADQSLLTGIGAAAYTTLDTEQLISQIRVALADALSSLTDFEGRVISVSEVHALLIMIHDILDNAVSKWVGNSTCISAHIFNSASRKYHEVWASQFPFLHSLKDMVPPSKACLCGCIN